MGKLLIVVVSLILLAFNSFAGSGINDLTMKDFLATSENDFRLETHKELTSFIDKASSNTPYLNQVELRTETSEFDLMKQRYAVRFYPKGWGETKYDKIVSGGVKTINRTEYNAKFNLAVRIRYNLILDYLEVVSLIDNKRKLRLVFQEKVALLKKMNNVSALIQAEEDLINLKLNIIELQNLKTGLIRDINKLASSKANVYFNQERLANLADIEELVSRISEKNGLENFELIVTRNRVDLAQNQYFLEMAKNKDYITFIQGGYDTDHAADFDKAYSLKLGIRLPFINPDRDDINTMKIAHIKEKLKYEEQKRAVEERITCLSREIGRYIRQYRLLSQFKEERVGVINTEEMNPLDELGLCLANLKNDSRLLKLETRIRMTLINLLDLVGDLSKRPLRNYLAKTE